MANIDRAWFRILVAAQDSTYETVNDPICVCVNMQVTSRATRATSCILHFRTLCALALYHPRPSVTPNLKLNGLIDSDHGDGPKQHSHEYKERWRNKRRRAAVVSMPIDGLGCYTKERAIDGLIEQ